MDSRIGEEEEELVLGVLNSSLGGGNRQLICKRQVSFLKNYRKKTPSKAAELLPL